jgi:hypothetical protein
MTWTLHIPGENPELDKMLARRGGPGLDYPCKDQSTVECALWRCQERGACQSAEGAVS